MINVTVIKGKDTIKYLVRIIAIIVLMFILARYFGNLKETNVLAKQKEDNNEYGLISCLEETIPQAKQVQMKQDNSEEEKIEPIKTVLNSELNFLDALNKKDEVTVEKLASNESGIHTENVDIVTNNDNLENNINESLKNIEEAQTNLKTEVIQNNVPNKYTNTHHGVQIKNESGLEIKESDLDFDLFFNTKDILIFHTHTCESYTSSEKFKYEQNSSFRTTDLNFSVARVGEELTNQLKFYGYNVLHNTSYHDYPAYNGSYARSLTTVQNLLQSSSNADVVIDIHRDALADSSYAPKVKIGDEYACQLMFVIGTNGSGLKHDNWIQNLKFAIMVQEKANEMYPGLFKPIIVRNSRYNQQLAKCASIIEVGATGNTLDEANTSMKYLSKVLSEVLKPIN